MKLTDLTEQLQKRRPKEEIAAEKAAPGYWRQELRKELNAVVKKFGGVTREGGTLGDDHRVFYSQRRITVLVSGADSLTIHRDKRAKAMLLAIGRVLLKQAEMGRKVVIGFWAGGGKAALGHSLMGAIQAPPSMDDIMHRLNDAARIDDIIDQHQQQGERGEKLPIIFDLRFSVIDLSKQ